MLLVSMLALGAIQTAPTPAPAPIMTVMVQKLPATYRQAPVVRLEFDGTGQVVKCTVSASSGNTAIDKVACQQVAQVKVPTEGNKAPEPRDATVEFTTEAPKG